MKLHEVEKAISEEWIRATLLHPFNHPDEYLAILMEEVGEVAKAAQGDGVITDELIQVITVCLRWLQHL